MVATAWPLGSDLVRSYSTSLSASSCESLASLLTSAALQQLFRNGTRWLAAHADPRNPLERAVRDIFLLHSVSLEYRPAESGAEYWVGFRDELLDGRPGGGVHLHRDFDLGAEEASGRSDVVPNTSTITYLTAAPTMPTVVLSGFDRGDKASGS